MPRLRNIQSGAVVSCTDETASRLGSEWVDADAPAKMTGASAPAKKTK